MSNHTPGPWKLKLGKGVEYTYQIKTDDVPIACFEHYSQLTKTQSKANARLMAAAPELLEALQGVLLVADRKTDEFDAARAAISKATGQNNAP